MNVFLGLLTLLAIAVLGIAAVTFIGIRMSRDSGRHGRSGSLGNAMLEMQALIDPGKRKVIEARQQMEEAEEQDESGDPPAK